MLGRHHLKLFSRYFLILCIFSAVFVIKFNDDVLQFYKNKLQTKTDVNIDIEFNGNETSVNVKKDDRDRAYQQRFVLDENFTLPEFRWCIKNDVTPPFDCEKLFDGTVILFNLVFTR